MVLVKHTQLVHLQVPPQHSPAPDDPPQHEQGPLGPILALEGLKVFVFLVLIAKTTEFVQDWERMRSEVGGREAGIGCLYIVDNQGRGMQIPKTLAAPRNRTH